MKRLVILLIVAVASILSCKSDHDLTGCQDWLINESIIYYRQEGRFPGTYEELVKGSSGGLGPLPIEAVVDLTIMENGSLMIEYEVERARGSVVINVPADEL